MNHQAIQDLPDEEQTECQITSIKLENDGTVCVNLSDDRQLQVSYDTWTELNLPRDEYLSFQQLEKLEEKALYTMIRFKALDLLTAREHSRKELKQKLQQKFYKRLVQESEDLIEQCLQDLEERDFQNDERFMRLFIESRLSSKLHGPYRILADLQNRGISREKSEALLNEMQTHEQWVEKAMLLLKKLQKTGKPKNKASLGQKLYQNGFTWDTISESLEKSELPDPSYSEFS